MFIKIGKKEQNQKMFANDFIYFTPVLSRVIGAFKH